MIEIIREIVVKAEACGRFELTFGPGGAWGRLFGRAAGFRGITLLRDIKDRRRHLMIEVWDSEAQREQALAANRAGYDSLCTALADQCETQTELGAYTMLAAAGVRPARRS